MPRQEPATPAPVVTGAKPGGTLGEPTRSRPPVAAARPSAVLPASPARPATLAPEVVLGEETIPPDPPTPVAFAEVERLAPPLATVEPAAPESSGDSSVPTVSSPLTGWVVPARAEIDAVVAEFTGPRRRAFARALQRSGRFLPMIREVLDREGLPAELAYLPLVESHYTADARSPAGAVGLWQFIDTTARASGLRVDWWVDERLDPEAATRAAARHLRELYRQFGDWELALAAYNAGPGGVSRALQRSGAEDFWGLSSGAYLRAETRRYLPKFYASVIIAANPERYGFDPEAKDSARVCDTVQMVSPVDVYSVARVSGIDVRVLKRWNPALKRGCTPPGEGAYPLRVPSGEGARVSAALARLGPEERTEFVRHRVAAGDTLWGISRRYGTRSRAVAELNGIADVRLLRPGQQLAIPVRRGAPRQPTVLKAKRRTADTDTGAGLYVVQPTDTVAAIARLHRVTVNEVLRWNGLGPRGLIRPGQGLVVWDPLGGDDARVVRVRVHVVERGDTLWRISRRYGVTLESLLRANNLAAEAVLRPGDELVVEATGPS